MVEWSPVSVKVISQKGKCDQEHKVGDEWIVGMKTPAGICLAAYNSIYPYIRVLMFGGAYPWQEDPTTVQVTCTDPKNPVVFELRRLKK